MLCCVVLCCVGVVLGTSSVPSEHELCEQTHETISAPTQCTSLHPLMPTREIQREFEQYTYVLCYVVLCCVVLCCVVLCCAYLLE